MRIQPLVRPLVTLLLLLLGQGTSLASAAGLTCARRAESAASSFADARVAAESHRQEAPAPDHDSGPEAPAAHAAASCTAPAMPADAPPRLGSGATPAAPFPPRFLPPIRLLADSQFRPPRLS